MVGTYRALVVVAWLLQAAGCSTPVARPSPTGDATDVAPTGRSAAASDVAIAALSYLDRPYRAGGHSADSGFDCSGFTRHVFAQTLGMVLPRQADEQAHATWLKPVPRSALQPGDLVFFNTLGRTFSHVGIFVGDGRFVHAPRTGARVRVESMTAPYWSRRFTGARRATNDVAL
jgi:cell wall-associated NlpC family hydrolase